MRNKLFAFLALTLVAALNLQLTTAFAQSGDSLCNGRLSDNGSSDLTFALFKASNGFDPARNTPTSLGTGMSDDLFALALDADAENGDDDWSSEKDVKKFKPLAASDERCVRSGSRLVSQTTIFQNHLFSPFKPRSPP